MMDSWSCGGKKRGLMVKRPSYERSTELLKIVIPMPPVSKRFYAAGVSGGSPLSLICLGRSRGKYDRQQMTGTYKFILLRISAEPDQCHLI